MKPRTRAVHAGREAPGPGRPAESSPAIHPAAAPLFDRLEDLEAAYEDRAFFYRRYGSANQVALEAAILDLEGGGAGHVGIATASGMSALNLACLALNPERQRVVGANGLYGGTLALLGQELPRMGVATDLVDLTDEASLGRSLDGAGVLLVETISNPAMRVADIPALAAAAHAAGAALLVDNTFASPVLCRPLEHGADAVMESATKYLGGHSDAMVGTLVLGAEAGERARQVARVHGAVAAPLECWLVLRGIRTTGLRVEAASRSAQLVAEALAGHPAVERVDYPGLGPDPVAGRLLRGGFGGMLSITLRGGEPAAMRTCARLRLVAIMPSLADVATTVSHPTTTSHRGMREEDLLAAGTSAGMLRLSIGVEDVDDILEDLLQALP
ncbi:MAG: PLP-dependent aspartate aminotransferase family protein [Candidatus Dormibacteraeota bacterium]|nr:PLP-dependent aspartate aminotransferase family protein [Candidatus Dormibacteraeota bacterium]